MEKYHCVMAKVPMFAGLKKIHRQILDEDLYDLPGFGRTLDPHVTLLYGLHNEDDYFAVRRLLQNVKKIPIELGKISKFTADDYDVIKIDVISDMCKQLHEKIKEECVNTQTHADYKPHITIAYVKPGSADQLLEDVSVLGETFDLRECVFNHKDDYNLVLPVGKHGKIF